jgi:putative DNA primase/helicase
MSRDDSKIVEFPKSEEIAPEERARRLTAEVQRLASLPVAEWLFYIGSDGLAEKHGISRAVMKDMVESTIKEREKRAREDKAEGRQREQRGEKEQAKARKEEERKRREQKCEQDEQRREQEREQKEEQRRREKRAKEFETIAKLPRLAHESRLAELAKRLGEDIELLREEFAGFVVPDEDTKAVEPWSEPVETAVLLTELMAQLRRFVVLHDDAAIAITLWVCFAWVHELAVHSPLLVITSPEADSGKTTTLGVLERVTPRPYGIIEMTGPGLFHVVDRLQPTLLIDEADQIFRRRVDLAHIVNGGWTRGRTVPRIVRGETQQFNVFCPKVLGMKGVSLPSTTASRAIVCKLWPKLPSEQITDFRHADDDSFVTLRRKALRWSADNAVTLQDANPTMPPGFNNRLAVNWHLLLAIADLAGGTWPKQARAAAVKLSHKRHQQSEGLRLRAALGPILAARQEITSADLVIQLNADPDGEWIEFRGRGPITQRQVAALLADYEIYPVLLHPTKRAGLSRRGYRRSQFDEVFARFPPPDPNIRTLQRGKSRKPK